MSEVIKKLSEYARHIVVNVWSQKKKIGTMIPIALNAHYMPA
jgi:hypothetical protein